MLRLVSAMEARDINSRFADVDRVSVHHKYFTSSSSKEKAEEEDEDDDESSRVLFFYGARVRSEHVFVRNGVRGSF